MNTAFILAKFIGKDTSLNYKKGKVYPLIISKLNLCSRGLLGDKIEISRLDTKGNYSYKNEESFYDNWMIVPEGKYMVKVEKIDGTNKK